MVTDPKGEHEHAARLTRPAATRYGFLPYLPRYSSVLDEVLAIGEDNPGLASRQTRKSSSFRPGNAEQPGALDELLATGEDNAEVPTSPYSLREHLYASRQWAKSSRVRTM